MLRHLRDPYTGTSTIAPTSWKRPSAGLASATKPEVMFPSWLDIGANQSGAAPLTQFTFSMNTANTERPTPSLRCRPKPCIIVLWRKIEIDGNCEMRRARAPSRSLLRPPPIAGPRLVDDKPQSQQLGQQARAADGDRVVNLRFHSLLRQGRYARCVQPPPVNTSPNPI